MKYIVKIREANIEDTSLLSSIISMSYQTVADRFGLTPKNCPKHPSNCTDKWIQHDFAKGIKYYLILYSELSIGCAALEKADNHLGYLERLAILPDYRHRGFGKMLVNHIFIQAKELKLKKVSIGIISKDTELKVWYQKHGFVEGATKEFSQLPFLVTFMMCEL